MATNDASAPTCEQANGRRSRQVLYAAEAISGVGTSMTLVALPFAILAAAGSGFIAMTVLTLEGMAIALGGIFSGAVIQRFGPRRSMVVSDSTRSGSMALLAVTLTHDVTVATAVAGAVLVLVIGIWTTVHYSAQRSVIDAVSARGDGATTSITSWLQASIRSAEVIGPLAGAALLTAWSAPIVLLIDACTFAISAMLLAFVFDAPRVPVSDQARASSPAQRTRILLALRDPHIRAAVMSIVCADAVFAMILGPGLMLSGHPQAPTMFALATSGFCGGALLGAPIAARFRRGTSAQRGGIAMVAQMLPLTLLPIAIGHRGSLLGIMVLSGLANTTVVANLFDTIRHRSHADIQPSLFGWLTTVTQLVGPATLTPAAAITAATSPHILIGSVASCGVAASIMLLRTLMTTPPAYKV